MNQFDKIINMIDILKIKLNNDDPIAEDIDILIDECEKIKEVNI